MDIPKLSVVVVMGAAGIGKSRLRHEWLTRLRTESAAQLWITHEKSEVAQRKYAPGYYE